MRIRFTVPGDPVGKGRPRFVRATGRTFTPQKTASYENLVKLEFQQQCEGQRFYSEEQLRMTIKAYFTVPASDSKRKREAKLNGTVRPAKVPDCDNVGKVIADSLNGIAYRDDAQIVSMTIDKFYSEVPRVEVWITTTDEKGE